MDNFDINNEDDNKSTSFLGMSHGTWGGYRKGVDSNITIPSLKNLLQGCDYIQIKGDKAVGIRYLTTDSRRVMPGSLFFAIPGFRKDGHYFLEEALARGAVAVVTDQNLKLFSRVTCIQVKDVRATLARIARTFYNKPDEGLSLIGITGTNGKSTVSFLTQNILKEENQPVGLLGTILYDVGKRVLPAHRTTPDALEFYDLLSQTKENNCKQVVMEVSSHGLHQKRIYGVHFDIAVFLNLSQDHIDYHGSMDHYFESKCSFFQGGLGAFPENAIVNIDDSFGRELLQKIPKNVNVLTFGIHNQAGIRAQNIHMSTQGSSFEVVCGPKTYFLETRLIGMYNISNILAALAICHLVGKDLQQAANKIKQFKGIPGRLEKIDEGQDYTVLVDYAHTDDALDNMLKSVKSITKGRLLVVFGCGGDRDRTKRPKMTQAVQRYADYAWATSDNPRKEAVSQIFEDMKKGIIYPDRICFEEDRRYAIHLALDNAKEEDVVVIAGKGHETYQEFADTIIPFDDRLVAKELLQLKHI